MRGRRLAQPQDSGSCTVSDPKPRDESIWVVSAEKLGLQEFDRMVQLPISQGTIAVKDVTDLPRISVTCRLL
jgi:hypothetical protein